MDGIPDVLAGYTSYLLRRVAARAGRIARGTLPAGHHPREIAVLRILAERDAVSQQDLANRLRINRTIMVKVIDKLEGVGYVQRQRNPADRRSYLLSATDAGRRALPALTSAVATGERQLTAALRPAERQRLEQLLEKLLPEQARLAAPAGPYPRTGYLLIGAHYYLKQRGDDALASVGVEVRHFGALAALAEAQPCSQQHLARQLDLAEPVMVPVVEHLQDTGLVQRQRDPHDRRQYVLHLTPAGRTRLRQARTAIDALQAEVTAVLGPDGDEELRGLLRTVLTAE